jgi:hypothetical protein
MMLSPNNPDAPKYWMHETSGVLEPVIRRFLNEHQLRDDEIATMQAYLWQWVKSPAWAPSGMLEALRLRVASIRTMEDIDQALAGCEELGMDPL